MTSRAPPKPRPRKASRGATGRCSAARPSAILSTPLIRTCRRNGASKKVNSKTLNGSPPLASRPTAAPLSAAAKFMSAPTTTIPAIPRKRATKAWSCASTKPTANSSGNHCTTSCRRVMKTTTPESASPLIPSSKATAFTMSATGVNLSAPTRKGSTTTRTMA